MDTPTSKSLPLPAALNGNPSRRLIDPNIDLAGQKATAFAEDPGLRELNCYKPEWRRGESNPVLQPSAQTSTCLAGDCF